LEFDQNHELGKPRVTVMASSSCWSGVVPPGLVVVAVAATCKGYRYPIEVIGHAVWLYHRFALSLRDVEELMLAVRRDVARGEWSRSIGGRLLRM
jgi:hypothetical protein